MGEDWFKVGEGGGGLNKKLVGLDIWRDYVVYG